MHLNAISVGATIEGIVSSGTFSDYKPSDQVKERLGELGLKILIEPQIPSINLKMLEKKFWELGKDVKQRNVSWYTNHDFIKALNFLEVFCLYASQFNALAERHPVKHKEGTDYAVDKTVIKAVREIEHLNDVLKSHAKGERNTAFKTRVNSLNNYIDKIFARDLGQTEQIAMNKLVQKAKKVLTDFSNWI